jgi:integrase
MARATGHVKLVQRKRGPVFYAKVRPAVGKQTTRLIGPAWPKRGRPPEGFYTRAMAEAKLMELLNGAVTTNHGNHTFGEVCEEWLRYLEQEKQVAERTLGTNRGAVRARLLPFFGADTPVTEITTERIDAYRAHSLTIGGRHGRPLKRSTVGRDMANLSGILTRAVKRGWITTNPYADAEKVSQHRPDDFNVLSIEEVEAVARASAPQHAALVRAAAYTGLRFGELRALRWADIDFEGGNLHVRRNLPVGAKLEKGPKGRRRRSVPLIDQAAAAFDGLSRRSYLTRRDDLVFVGPSGSYLDYETVKDAFYGALDRAGLGRLRHKREPITFHDLRHTYGTTMAAVYPLHDLMAYMGHAQLATTERYLHHIPKHDAAAKGTAYVAAQMRWGIESVAA